jgi:pimeloyl-ACP methyl ester carboxylesterase
MGPQLEAGGQLDVAASEGRIGRRQREAVGRAAVTELHRVGVRGAADPRCGLRVERLGVRLGSQRHLDVVTIARTAQENKRRTARRPANPKGSIAMSRQLMVPAADTRLHVVDDPGRPPAVVLLSGGFGTVHNWSHVIRRLDGRYRTVRFDARARGRSGRSADYSVPSAVDDIGRIIDATGIERPILVGWSHGATIAVRYAAEHPGGVRGLVLVDGAFPISMLDEAGRQKVRAQFRRLGWMMRILAALGRSARMSPAESADVVIEMDAVNGELGADFAALDCPTVFVVGTGAHSGATEDEMRTVRAAVTDAEESNERVSVFATTPHNHTQILSKAPDTVVAAIEDVIHTSS